MIISKKNKDHILDTDNNGKGPEDKGHNPKDVHLSQGNGMVPVKTLLDCVEWAGPYISINDTKGTEGEYKGSGSWVSAVRILFHWVEMAPLSPA